MGVWNRTENAWKIWGLVTPSGYPALISGEARHSTGSGPEMPNCAERRLVVPVKRCTTEYGSIGEPTLRDRATFLMSALNSITDNLPSTIISRRFHKFALMYRWKSGCSAHPCASSLRALRKILFQMDFPQGNFRPGGVSVTSNLSETGYCRAGKRG